MAQNLDEILAEYRRQYKIDPATADRSLLDAGLEQLQTQLQNGSLEPQLVHTGRELLDRLGNLTLLSDLLTRYLSQSLSLDEEAWARWHLEDYLAVVHRCTEAVAKHREFLQWARTELTDKNLRLSDGFPFLPVEKQDGKTLAPESLLFWVMGDGTQAKCWVETGCGDEWISIGEEILATAINTPRNRFRRFNFLRTFVSVLSWMSYPEKAMKAATRIAALAEEEEVWEEAQGWQVQAQYVKMRIYADAHNAEGVRREGMTAISLLDEFERKLSPLSEDQYKCLGGFNHDIACPLRGVGQYDLAIPLFQRAIACKSANAWTYLYLAAALWATTKSRAEVLELLRQAAYRYHGDDILAEAHYHNLLPEFADVTDDPAFAMAARAVAKATPK